MRWGPPEAVWREAYYSHAGDFSQCVLEAGAPWWLGAMHLRAPMTAGEVSVELLRGQNTFVQCSEAGAEGLLPVVEAALVAGERGTQVAWVLPQRLLSARSAGEGGLDWSARLADAGFGVLQSCESGLSVPFGAEGVGRRRLTSPWW